MKRADTDVSGKSTFNFFFDRVAVGVFVQDSYGENNDFFEFTELIFFHLQELFPKCRNKPAHRNKFGRMISVKVFFRYVITICDAFFLKFQWSLLIKNY